MTINLQVPDKQSLKPRITVLGVGGAGGNAVNNMIRSGLSGVKFVIANTDAQALEEAVCENCVQLGEDITQGLGAGSYPEVGKASAEEALEELADYLDGSHMVFVTAGMGGGTGTGAAPVIARLAREQGILTVAVVTKPFHFEGSHRMRVAELGLQELQKYVDTLIVIPNQNLFRVADKSTTFLDAFNMADEVLHSGVRGITDLMVMPGLINLDFSDVRSVMSEMGKAMMGTGEGEGDHRSVEAAEAAIANPLLDNVSMQGARGVLINITGGPDMTLFEVDEAANRIREEVDPEANIIFGSAFDPSLEGRIRVSVVATGIDGQTSGVEHPKPRYQETQAQAKPAAEPANHSFETAAAAEGDSGRFSGAEMSDADEDLDDALAAEAAAEDATLSFEQPEFFDSPEPVEPKAAMPEDEAKKPANDASEAPPKMPEFLTGSTSSSASGGGLLSSLFGKKSAVERDDVDVTEVAVEKPDQLDVPAFIRRKSGS